MIKKAAKLPYDQCSKNCRLLGSAHSYTLDLM